MDVVLVVNLPVCQNGYCLVVVQHLWTPNFFPSHVIISNRWLSGGYIDQANSVKINLMVVLTISDPFEIQGAFGKFFTLFLCDTDKWNLVYVV